MVAPRPRRSVAILALAAFGVACRTGPADPAPPDPQQPPAAAASPGPAPEGWTAHADAGVGYRILYPPGFVLRPRSAAERVDIEPPPAVAVSFLSPVMAAGARAGIEPPDLELRAFPAPAEQPLEDWLAEAGFLAGGATRRLWRAGRTSGLEVCLATLLAPGCSMFFRSASHVFQLTPASLEGEAMVRTFELTGP